MKKRPKKWVSKYEYVIDESSYNMPQVHRFVKWCFKKVKIKIKEEFFNKTHFRGLCLFDRDMIYVCGEQCPEETMITILHECFHIYFRDVDDNRKRQRQDDPVERRAEDSAVNMLQWYKSNEKYYKQFLELVESLPTEKLTQEELDDI